MRSRITERLDRAARFPVTLIVAPAGFGKTVALRDYLDASGVAAIRFNVRREDATLLSFVRSLSEALEPVAPSALAAYPAMQQRVLASEEPVRALSDWFVEHLKQASFTIAVDDLHFAAGDPASIAMIADLIERTTDRIRWIVSARSDVGLPVGTWMAYGRMDMPIGEEDLRFTTSEALAAADEMHTGVDPAEVEALRQLTEGWPVALTIAVRTRTHVQDLRTASSGTREMVYRYLAEQVFAGLTLAQRAFILATSVFSTFDTGIAEALGATPEFLSEIRRSVAFLTEAAPGQYKYHDLFRDFLETELRRSGEREWTRAICDAAAILERRGEDAAALLLYAKARAGEAIVSIVDRAAFDLFERGEGDALAAALATLPEPMRRTNPAALGLSAMLEASRGHFDVAERDFKEAISLARDRDLRAQLVLRYAIETVRHDRDSTKLLEPYAADTSIPPSEQAPLLGTLATAYARAGRIDEAVQTVQRALDVLPAAANDRDRARLYHQAAYVYQYVPDWEQTERYATLAVEIARERNLDELAARAYSILYAVRYEADDPLGSLEMLDRLIESARKGASGQARVFGLMAEYEVQAERGDEAALETLERTLEETRAPFTPARAEALVPAMAMRTAWTGEFRRAYELCATAIGEQLTVERRALVTSQAAFYAIAAGLSGEANEAYHNAVSLLERIPKKTLRTTLTQVFLALVDLVRAHHSSAHRLLSEAESHAARWPRVRAFANAGRTLYRVHLGQADAAAMEQALERMRSAQFGGAARLIAALPSPEAKGGGYMQLTPSEREILQFLASGASTKDIANRTGRSAHTVDTHIRAICRKLQCSGRREAVALAVGAGWVHG
ncbi:MAG TPA: LuxR C-terminal-related transcriptional regulator [Candidatus Baltobacteraceae bacterium]|jgi:LuxR family maltose regulon positive regulatory protein|nr:LuxR C-terminal-related transcriptional regulator [Candidatus Baltobacteraceae bacterium]